MNPEVHAQAYEAQDCKKRCPLGTSRRTVGGSALAALSTQSRRDMTTKEIDHDHREFHRHSLFAGRVGVAAFQLALALGAPWGTYVMGGTFPGSFPPAMRAAARRQH